MSNSVHEAINSFHRWNDAWNEGNVEKQILEMHFPHIRLDGQNKFTTLEKADDFRASQPAINARLTEEKWHHTSTLSIHAAQTGPKKVHLIINPYSGKKKGLEVGNFVEQELTNSKIVVKKIVSEKPIHAISIVENLILEKGDAVVTVGCDGTFCEVISGFMSRKDDSYS